MWCVLVLPIKSKGYKSLKWQPYDGKVIGGGDPGRGKKEQKFSKKGCEIFWCGLVLPIKKNL